MSREAFPRRTPVSPPIVNRKMNPRVQTIDGVYFIFEPKIVASHLNTLIPVGTAITIVDAVK